MDPLYSMSRIYVYAYAVYRWKWVLELKDEVHQLEFRIQRYCNLLKLPKTADLANKRNKGMNFTKKWFQCIHVEQFLCLECETPWFPG